MKIDYETGIVADLGPIESEFNDFLKTLGINSLFTDYHGTNYLSIWVASVAEVTNAKEIAKSNYEQIISHFKSLLAKYKHPADFEKYPWEWYSVSNVYSFEIACVNRLVRRCKGFVIRRINNELKIQPEYFFCHSECMQTYSTMPGYHIVYTSPKQLARSAKQEQDKIIMICDEILKENDKSGSYMPARISISFWDTKSSASDMYGMSRED